MIAPIEACTISRSYSPFADERWLVEVDADAAEIMGETRLTYHYNTLAGAEKFAAMVQANLDASWISATQ